MRYGRFAFPNGRILGRIPVVDVRLRVSTPGPVDEFFSPQTRYFNAGFAGVPKFTYGSKYTTIIPMSTNDERFTHGRTSVYNLNYHIIWCTKYRRKVLKNGIDSDLKAILQEIADEHGYRIPHMEVGLDDHIHLFVSAPPKISVSSIVKQLKGTSSLRLFAMHPELKSQYWKRKGERSLWSPSYFVESIGTTNEQAVAKYIDGQREKEREQQ